MCYFIQSYMGGVDHHDELRMKYDVGRNSKKCWRYLFWFLINCAVTNAFIIYKKVSTRPVKRKKYSHLDFRMELAKDLIAGFSSRKQRISEPGRIPFVDKENYNGHSSVRLPGI